MMLRRFDIYIIRTLLVSMVVVFLCVGLLLAMFGVIDEARGVDETRSFATIVLVVLFDLPGRISAITNYIVLMGALIGLGALSQNSEVTALRAAGVAPARLCIPVAAASLLFFAGIFVLAEFIGPQLQTFTSKATGDQDESRQFDSLWYKEGDTYTQLLVIDSDLRIEGLRQFQLSPTGALSRTAYATVAIPHDEKNIYILNDVVETTFTDDQLLSSKRATDTWHLRSILKSLPQRIKYEPNDLSYEELLQHVEYLRQEDRDSTEFEVEFWARVTRPLSIIGMVLLTVGFVVGPLRETGMGTRIGVGLVVGILLEYFQRMLIPFASLYGIPALVVVAIPVVLVLAVGILLIRRIN